MPAYPMPDDLPDVTVQRIVVRNGFSHDLASSFLDDLRTEVDYLDKLSSPLPDAPHSDAFHH